MLVPTRLSISISKILGTKSLPNLPTEPLFFCECCGKFFYV